MSILNMVNILRTHGINPSSIPSNISSISNHELLNDIRKLRAKLNPKSPEYKKAQALYKKVIKPVNIAFIKLLIAQQYYSSVNNNPLADLDYLFGQYDSNTIENPVVYRLLTEHRLQRNLFKYIILTEFCKNADNASAEEIEKLDVDELIKELVSLRDMSSSAEEQAEICMLIDQIQKKLVSIGMKGGGGNIEQKLSATIVLAYCALFTNEEKIKNIAKSLIKKYSTNPEEVLNRLSRTKSKYDATVVADTTIDFDKGVQSISKLILSEYGVESIKQILSSGNYDDLIMENLIPARDMHNIDYLLVDEPIYKENSSSIADVELVDTTYKEFWENFGFEKLNLTDSTTFTTFMDNAKVHEATKKNNPVISRYLENLERMLIISNKIYENKSKGRITDADIYLFGELFKDGASKIMLEDLWTKLSSDFNIIINNIFFVSGKVGDNISKVITIILEDLQKKQKNVDDTILSKDIKFDDSRFQLQNYGFLDDGLFKEVLKKYIVEFNNLMDVMVKQINFLKKLNTTYLLVNKSKFLTNFMEFPMLPNNLVKKISVITKLNDEKDAINQKLIKNVDPDQIFKKSSSSSSSSSAAAAATTTTTSSATVHINLEDIAQNTDLDKIDKVLDSYKNDGSMNTVDSSGKQVLWNNANLPYERFIIFKNAINALMESLTKIIVQNINDSTGKKIGLVLYGRFIALGSNNLEKGYFDIEQIKNAGVENVPKNPGTTDKTPFTDIEKEILKFIFLTKYFEKIRSGKTAKLSLSLNELPDCIEVETKELTPEISTFYYYDVVRKRIYIGKILNNPIISGPGVKDLWGYYLIKNIDTNDYMINNEGSTKSIKSANLGKTSTGGGFYKKYLKYKSKYLQIK
jgi:hypothetical protein